MHCPFCQHHDTRVIDSRVSDDGATIRRRRECEACGERVSTLETVELKLPAIIKSDGRRDNFDARKLRHGFDRALHKRPVSEEQIEAAVRAAKDRLRPILMTSFAFILGAVPLVIADGAGAELRQALGTAVFFGMIGVTGFGLLFTPTFYVVARALAMRFERRKPAPAATLQPAE